MKKSHLGEKKAKVYDQIRNSFFGSQVGSHAGSHVAPRFEDEKQLKPPGVPENYTEVKKNTNILPDFRNSVNEDPEKKMEVESKL